MTQALFAAIAAVKAAETRGPPKRARYSAFSGHSHRNAGRGPRAPVAQRRSNYQPHHLEGRIRRIR